MADKQDSDSEKGIRIIVDGTPHLVPTDEVTFDAVLDLAYPGASVSKCWWLPRNPFSC